jgi:hypothetical protein
VTLNATAAAVGVAWLAGTAGWSAPAPLAAGLSGASFVAIACWRGLRPAPVALDWNGRGWSLDASGGSRQPGQLDVMIDLGGWLLLRFRPEDGAARRRSHWFATAGGGRRAAWSAFRAALYSSAPQTPLASVRADSQPD